MKRLKKYTLAIITSIILLTITIRLSYYVYEVPEYLVGWMACLGFYEGNGLYAIIFCLLYYTL